MTDILTKLGVLFLICLGCLFAGYQAGKGQREVITIEKVIKGETEIKIVERIVTKTITIKPDGTTVTKEETKDKVKDVKEKETSSDSSSMIKPILPEYSLGLRYHQPLAPLQDWPSGPPEFVPERTEIVLGRRLLGDFWINVGYRFDRSVSLGLEVQL